MGLGRRNQSFHNKYPSTHHHPNNDTARSSASQDRFFGKTTQHPSYAGSASRRKSPMRDAGQTLGARGWQQQFSFANQTNADRGFSNTAYTGFYNGNIRDKAQVLSEDETMRLKGIICKLEKKAENRKFSLKQLYGILTNKEKDLETLIENRGEIHGKLESCDSVMSDGILRQKSKIDSQLDDYDLKLAVIVEKFEFVKLIGQGLVANNVKEKQSHQLELQKRDALLKTEIAKSKKILRRLEDENSKLKNLEPISTLKDAEICRLEVEVENLRNQLSEMEKFRSQLKIFSNYKEKYDEQCRKNELMSENEAYRDSYYQLQETVKSIEDQSLLSKKTTEKLRLKNRELESELEMLKVNYHGLEGELEFLEQSKVGAEARMRQAEGRGEASDAERKVKVREYEVSIAEWKSKSERGDRELVGLKEETRILGERLQGKEGDFAKENELRLKGESRARELEREKRELVSEADTLRQAIEDIQEIGTKGESSLKENLKNLEKQREMERELKKRLSAEREAAQIISKDLESLQKDNQDLIVQNRALENQNSDLAALIKSLKSQQGGITQTLDSKTNQLSGLESVVATLRGEKLELMNQLADSRKSASDKLKSVSNEYDQRLKN